MRIQTTKKTAFRTRIASRVMATTTTSTNKPTIPSITGKADTDLTKHFKHPYILGQKQTVRTRIGAGTSSFDGAYDSLTGKPTGIPVVTPHTSAFTVAASDLGDTLTCSGTFTITLPDITGDTPVGFYFWVVNSGTGTITIDGNAGDYR